VRMCTATAKRVFIEQASWVCVSTLKHTHGP
jgi:hypothetical protein